MKKYLVPLIVMVAIQLTACKQKNTKNADVTVSEVPDETSFEVENERFGDVQMLRYQVPGFNELTLKQKELCYYLYEAGLAGRDIIYDQKYSYNLLIRKTNEGIYESYKGDRNSAEFKQFEIWIKQVWFSNGIHHHYSNVKMIPEISPAYYNSLIKESDSTLLPLSSGQTKAKLYSILQPLIFNSAIAMKTVNLASDIDNVKGSANNFYEGVTQKEVENYYALKRDSSNKTPVSFGLNSKLVKENGVIVEKTWKAGGMYGSAIQKIIYWLDKASNVAENDLQKDALLKLISYYRTGDLRIWDEYSIAWVKDVDSRIDVVNGFIEVYQDAIAMRGSFESVVSIKDMEATKRIAAIAKEAQWFEDNSPLMPQHKKKNVKGISAKVITVVGESGDAAPSTPIGINLPNSNWVREQHGSKSVSLGNIVKSYNIVGAKSPTAAEFAFSDEIVQRGKKYGALAGDLHTDMHEVIGHASGQLNPGISTPDVTLKTYGSTLEEARADLVALYYIIDKKLVEIGVTDNTDVGKAEYDSYINNGMMTQLNRIKPGDNLEESHMRNRQLNASWVYEKGLAEKVVEKVTKNGKTYFKINDYDKLRKLFGDLLREIQRIKSEGDYASAKALVENYGVKVDKVLHAEVLERFSKLNVAPYKGFIQPKLIPIMENGKIKDVRIEYPTSFAEQMMEFGKLHSCLPVKN